jgi:hydrogenase expression/formation protein HypC
VNGGSEPPSGCQEDVCITCSDLAVQATVTQLLADGMALVDVAAGEEEVSVALVHARVGDVLLIHAKEALAVLGPATPS